MKKIIAAENMSILDVLSEQPAIGIYAWSSESFKNYMDSVKIDGSPVGEWRKAHPKSKDHDFLSILLPCGCSKKFNDKKDIPFKSIKCKHGNYFIKIGDDPDDNV